MAILWIIFYYYHFRIARYFYILYSEQNHLVLFSFVLEVHSGPYVYHRRVIWTRMTLICSIHISYFSLWLLRKIHGRLFIWVQQKLLSSSFMINCRSSQLLNAFTFRHLTQQWIIIYYVYDYISICIIFT